MYSEKTEQLAVNFRVNERLGNVVIARILNVSVRSIARWLTNYPLTKKERDNIAIQTNKSALRKKIGLDKYMANPNKCKYCDKPIKPHSDETVRDTRNRKFCCRLCSIKYYSEKKIKKIKGQKCLSCGKLLTTKYRKKFCNSKCQQNYLWKIKKKNCVKNNEVTVEKEAAARRFAKKLLLEKFGHRCSTCKKTQWNGKDIPLVLDHKNGKSWDFRLKNLQLVCPNCDMQSPTWGSRNIGQGRLWRREQYAKTKSRL